ncbi:MAG: deoxyribose-phosphate aldolase [Candidatus Gastranaerophilaceae bacterium]|jgi:deoxyribose-phosphate aldolase
MTEVTVNISNYIEHTLLKPEATKKQLTQLFDEAMEHNFLGVCINPAHVAFAKEYLKNSNVKIVTVIGFPLGANLSSVKAFETQEAVNDGADEIDMVINIGSLKNQDYQTVENDIKAVVDAAMGHPVKVILETDLLTKDEIAEASKICVEAGAKFVKTSTGFVNGGVGAKAEDIKLMHKTVTPFGLQVKASGGVRDSKKALEMIEAGATRIGTSSGIQILKGLVDENTGY